MPRGSKILFLVNCIILTGIFAYSIHRDIHLYKQTAGDLRNRVVGARLQKDGIAPYFYHWKKSDGTRYFDPANESQLAISNITATPFFHDLLLPVCDLPQSTIAIMWLCLQYVMLLIMALLFIPLCGNFLQRLFLLNFMALFTCTDAWEHLILRGQLYFIFAFLIAVILYSLLRGARIFYVITAALCTALLCFVRPTALIIFIPFLLRYKLFYRYLLASAACIAIYALFALVNTKENAYWKSYRTALAEHTKFHQGMQTTLQENEALVSMKELEGMNFEVTDRHQPTIISENGNFFVLFRYLLRRNIPLVYLGLLFFIVAAGATALFLYRQFKNGIHVPVIILFAGWLYMLSDLFSPVYRHQYYTVQWLPVLLLGILLPDKWKRTEGILIATGLSLNLFSIGGIPLHSVGEVCWLSAIALIIYRNRPVNVSFMEKVAGRSD